MKYLMMGSGGVGGALGGFLAASGRDVTFIARGAHHKAMREKGLRVHAALRGELWVAHPNVSELHDYHDTPDVIFVCVKSYSIGDAERLIERAALPNTIVIPLLNIYGTGGTLRQRFPKLHILDGCVYIFGSIVAPGEIEQKGSDFRVLFGEPDGFVSEQLTEIANDLTSCGIKTIVSSHIQRDCLLKYSRISPFAAVGAYYDADAGTLRENAQMMADYLALTGEISALADAMGCPLGPDVEEHNRKSMLCNPADATSSMLRDVRRKGPSEIDGLVFEPVRLGRRYGVPTPAYEKVARKFGF